MYATYLSSVPRTSMLPGERPREVDVLSGVAEVSLTEVAEEEELSDGTRDAASSARGVEAECEYKLCSGVPLLGRMREESLFRVEFRSSALSMRDDGCGVDTELARLRIGGEARGESAADVVDVGTEGVDAGGGIKAVVGWGVSVVFTTPCTTTRVPGGGNVCGRG
jgi:hypothetical protein